MADMFRRLNLIRKYNKKAYSFELVQQSMMPKSGDQLFAAFSIQEAMIKELPENMILAFVPQGRPSISEKVDSLQNEVRELRTENTETKLKLSLVETKVHDLEVSHYNMLVGQTAIGLAQYVNQLEVGLIKLNLPPVADLLGDRRLQLKEFKVAIKKGKEDRLGSEQMAEFLNIDAVQNLDSLIKSKGFGRFLDFRNLQAHPFISELSDLGNRLMTLSEKVQLLTESNKSGLVLCENYFKVVKLIDDRITKLNEENEQKEQKEQKERKEKAEKAEKDSGNDKGNGTNR